MRAISLWQPFASAIAWGDKQIETRSWGTRYEGLLLICATAKTPLDDFEAATCNRHVVEVLLRENIIDTSHGFGRIEPEPVVALKRLPQACAVAVAYLYACDMIEAAHATDDGGTFLRARALFEHPTEYTISPMEAAFGFYDSGRFAWKLRDVRPLPQPIPCKGAQGIWKVPAELEAQVRLALALPTTPSTKETLL